jgi:glycosyltransferase involved in cell wall biosynthesis
VLYVIDSLRAGGKERQAVALLRGLAARGHEVKVISMGVDNFFASALENANIPIHFVVRRGKADLSPWLAINRLVRTFRPHILHSTCWMTSLFSLPVCRLHGLPLVNGSIRNSFSKGGLKWKIERLLLRLADARISNSLAGFHSRGFDPKSKGNHVVYNGFDRARVAMPDKAIVEEMHARSRGRRIIGMVAQFKNDKDHHTFFEAAVRLLRRRDDVVFVTVGDGLNLKRYQSEYSHESRILFLGRRTDVESIVSSFFIGVLATFTEGISNAIMEYMALGKPVVATDGGGTKEVLANGSTGFLVPVGDSEMLAERIAYFLDHPDEAAAFGGRGRDRIRDLFSAEALIRQTAAVYQQVLPAVSA